MDVNDLEKDLSNFRPRPLKPRRRADLTVKHAGLKVALSRALAALFVLAVTLFAIFIVVGAKNGGIDVKIVGALAIVYLALGAYVAYKLWNLEFFGWAALLFISLAGVTLPAMSAISNGMGIGTVPIIGVSLAALAVLWWIRDLYRVKRIGDIFGPPQ